MRNLLLFTFFLVPSLGYADGDQINQQLQKLQQETEMVRENLTHMDVEPTRRTLNTFRTTSDMSTKIRAASELTLVGVKLDTSSKKQWPLSPEERNGIESAKRFMEEVNREAIAFESGLTDAELKQITQDQPGSLALAMKRLFLTTFPTCTEAQFQKLKKKLPAKDLAARGKAVMLLAGYYEDPAAKKYLLRVRALLKESPKHAKRRGLLLPYYGILEQNNEDAPLDRVPEYEKELVDSGVPRERLRNYVTETAALGPDCLGRLNIPFVKQWKKTLNEERGKFLLEAVRERVAKGEKPTTLDSIPVREGDAVYGDRKDPYGNFYEIKYGPKGVFLLSPGPDGEPGGGDDLTIGAD